MEGLWHRKESYKGLPWWLSGKESACQSLPMQETRAQYLGPEDFLRGVNGNPFP